MAAFKRFLRWLGWHEWAPRFPKVIPITPGSLIRISHDECSRCDKTRKHGAVYTPVGNQRGRGGGGRS